MYTKDDFGSDPKGPSQTALETVVEGSGTPPISLTERFTDPHPIPDTTKYIDGQRPNPILVQPMGPGTHKSTCPPGTGTCYRSIPPDLDEVGVETAPLALRSLQGSSSPVRH